MSAVKIMQFGGLIPRLSKKLIPNDAAQVANNCRIKSGRLEPIIQPSIDTRTGSVVTANCKTMHLWRHGENLSDEQWLSWDDYVAVARSTIADDDKFRLWIAGSTGVSSGNANNVPAVIGWSGGQKVVRPMKKVALASPTSAATWKFNASASNMDFYFSIAGTATAATFFGGGNTSTYIFNLVDPTIQPPTYKGTINSVSRNIDKGTVEIMVTTPEVTFTSSNATNIDSFWSGFNNMRLGCIFKLTDGTARWASSWEIGGQANVMQSGNVIGTLRLLSVDKQATFSTGTTSAPSHIFFTFPAQQIKFTFQECYSSDGDGNWVYSPAAGTYTNYLQTWVDDWGQESPPSLPSGQMFVQPGQTVTVAAISQQDQIADAVSRRIYRVVTGTEGEAWQFVTELTGASLWASFVDGVADEDTGEVLPTIENPPDDLDGLVGLPGGFLAGFRGREVCFSESWLPYSWPTAYRLTVDSDIIGLACSGNDVYVLTKSFPYVITGSSPDVMMMQKLAFPQPCMSRSSIVSSMGYVFYASPDGICGIQPGAGARVMTDDFFTRVEWQLLTPGEMMIAAHDGALHVFSRDSNGSAINYIIDFPDGVKAITTTDEYALVAYSDVETDTLYYVRGSGSSHVFFDQTDTGQDTYSVHKWLGGTENKVLTWRSKRFQDRKPQQFSAVKVTADSYGTNPQPLTVNVYAGEAPDTEFLPAACSISITGQKAWRLPRWRPERVFEIEIVSQTAVDDITMATNMEECR